ncbi:MAG: dTMP kinase [Balneolaceae bacterium]
MLISFEGIDGCGKSTQIKLLEGYFSSKGRKCSVYREPGGTEISERIRSLLLHETDEMNAVTELLLFSAARSQLITEKILPRLENKEVVILDRYYDSTTAYQGYGRKLLKLDKLHIINKLASHQTVPDLTFYLKISPVEAKKRTKNLQKDRMESSGDDFYQRVTEGYDHLAATEKRFNVLNAMKSPENIQSEIVEIIENFRKS